MEPPEGFLHEQDVPIGQQLTDMENNLVQLERELGPTHPKALRRSYLSP